MKRLRITRNQTGDTIVEVVLALTVLGLILGGSAVLVSRNNRSLQSTQEHSAGLRIAQTQLEFLKTYATDNPDKIASFATSNKQFCIIPDTEKAVETDDDYCTAINSGGKTVTDGEASYAQAITLAKDVGNPDRYLATVSVKWEGRTGMDGVDLTYTIYSTLGAATAVSVGAICPLGQIPNPDVASPQICIDAPPSIKVVVKKVSHADNTQPDCSEAANGYKSGTKVRLTDHKVGATPVDINTDGDSVSWFNGLQSLATYKIETITAPTGYELCTPKLKDNIVMSPGTLYPIIITDLKIKPICSKTDGSRNLTPVTTANPEYYKGRYRSQQDTESGYVRRVSGDVADKVITGLNGLTDYYTDGKDTPGSVLWKLKSWYSPDPGHTANTNGTQYLAYPWKTWNVGAPYDVRNGTYVYQTSTTTKSKQSYTTYTCPDAPNREVVTGTEVTETTTSAPVLIQETSTILNPIVP